MARGGTGGPALPRRGRVRCAALRRAHRCVAAPGLRPARRGAGRAARLECTDRRCWRTAAAAAGARHGAGSERPRQSRPRAGPAPCARAPRTQRDAQAEAAADLVKALGAHNAGRLDVAAGLARAARDGLQPYCPPLSEQAVNGMRSSAVVEPAGLPEAPARCEHRAAWHALLLLQHHAVDTGDWVGATQHARLARDLAALPPTICRARPQHRRAGLAHGAQRQHRCRAAAAAAGAAAGATCGRSAAAGARQAGRSQDGRAAR